MIGIVVTCLLLAACPAAAPESSGPGQAQIGRPPAQAAMDLNRAGKALYREGHLADARVKYEAAKQADPSFLAPWLNLACAYAREDRFAEATQEATALIRQAYVPGAREVMEAADLGALQIRPQWMAKLKTALVEASVEWGRATQGSLFLVARTQPPVKLAGPGVLVLGLNQEIYAWSPRYGHFLQVTSEDGRVLAFVQSPDRRTLVFVRAGRLLRSPDEPPVLRGLGLRQLDLDRFVLGPVVELPGDVRTLTIWPTGPSSVHLRVAEPSGAFTAFRFDGEALEAAGSGGRDHIPGGVHAVVLSGTGVAPVTRVVSDPGCGFSARDEIDGQGIPRIRVSASKLKAFLLDARYGAGLDGLPFPTPAPEASKVLFPAKKTR